MTTNLPGATAVALDDRVRNTVTKLLRIFALPRLCIARVPRLHSDEGVLLEGGRLWYSLRKHALAQGRQDVAPNAQPKVLTPCFRSFSSAGTKAWSVGIARQLFG